MDVKNLTDDFGVEVRNFDCSKKIGYDELNLLKKLFKIDISYALKIKN